ncbi:MAG: RNA polymerase sigma factor [Ignavibacteriae bacterium]|nr:RNA polymerase sigma factor [Ignavibacteriota bacterium]
MAHDPVSFTELYERYAQDVFRFAFWLSGDADDARDITAETFVRVWTSEQPIRDLSVKAYLFTIARRLYLQHRRRTTRSAPLTDENAGSSHDTERSLEDRSELEHVLRAMAELPEQDRAILVMRAAEELTHGEIAAATGLSIASVKVRIFRARAKLSSLLSSSGSST